MLVCLNIVLGCSGAVITELNGCDRDHMKPAMLKIFTRGVLTEIFADP